MEISRLFKCPDCGCKVLEEVMVDVTVASEIQDLDEYGDIHYGEQSNDDGRIDRFQCIECGWTVHDKDGITIQTTLELFNFLISPDSRCKP